MSEKFKVELRKEKCLKTGTIFQTARFLDDFGDSYGRKHFITELGEVAVINLFNKSEIPEALSDIKYYYEREKKRQSENNDVSLDQVWRYFADKSKRNKRWYMEAMYYHADCYYPDQYIVSDVIGTKEISADLQKITYLKWEKLSKIQKEEYIA